jgi:hypothetical protein
VWILHFTFCFVFRVYENENAIDKLFGSFFCLVIRNTMYGNTPAYEYSHVGHLCIGLVCGGASSSNMMTHLASDFRWVRSTFYSIRNSVCLTINWWLVG